MNIRQLPMGRRVLFTFGLLCSILLVIGSLLFFSLRAIERENALQQTRALDKLALIDDTAQDIGQMQAEVLRQIVALDPAEIKRLDVEILGTEKTNSMEMVDYVKFVDTEKEKRLYAEVMAARAAYWKETQPVMAMARQNRDAEAEKTVISTQAPAYDALIKALNDLIDEVEAGSAVIAASTSRFIATIRNIGDVLVALAIAIAIGTGRSVIKVIGLLRKDNAVLQNEISERRRAQETLRESEEKFRELAENTNDVFWISSPDMRQMHYVSPAYQAVWGRPPESLCARAQDWFDAVAAEDRERVFAVFGRLMAVEPKVTEEYRITRPDGETRWINNRGFQIRDAAGQVIRLAGVATDISERKRFEAQMFQSQRLETVGKLAGGVAHEFNSILTAIIGQCELLFSDLPPDSPASKHVTQIHQAADRAATLTRQLLAYGRKQILQPEVLDLNAVLAGMEGTLRHLFGQDVDVRTIPGAGLKPVRMDRGQIEQVIINIAMNAADIMPNGGKFTLETANATLDAEYTSHFQDLKPGEYTLLAISDTGPGIAPEVKKHIFEPFFSTKGVGQGAGLGLATCYGILKQSGGHINVYSEPSRGATFKVYLPQADVRPKAAPPRQDPAQLPRGTETILLVEDDPALREMASSLLRRLGYTVLAAGDGVEAIRLRHQHGAGHVDLVLTDVVMPHMSGKELADRCRQLYPRTRILFTSAYTENAIAHQGALDPGVTLLQKPFSPAALAAKVREVLDRDGPQSIDPIHFEKSGI